MGMMRNHYRPLLRSIALPAAILLCLFSFTVPSHAADKTIGVILPGDLSSYWDIQSEFKNNLKRAGVGGDVEIIIQRPFPDPISLSNAARKLIAIDVNLIVAYGTDAAMAVIKERTNIPLVYAGVYEPAADRLKHRNATGVKANVSVTSLIRYLRKLNSIKEIGVLYSSDEEESVLQLKEVTKAAGQYQFAVRPVNLAGKKKIADLLAGGMPEALFVTGSVVANIKYADIRQQVLSQKVLTAFFMLGRSWQGTLTMTFDPEEQGRQAADLAAKILQGTAPANVADVTSQKIELIFNLKQVTSMGRRIPMDLVTEATSLIK